MLQKLFSTFPDGWPGVGLILMRCAVALGVIAHGAGTLIEPPAETLAWTGGVLEILIGAALILGFLTPITGLSIALGSVAVGLEWFTSLGANMHEKAWTALNLGVISVALVLLGPGAFSVDAWLFGRREIIIPEVPRRPKV